MIVWLASYPRSGNTFLRVILNKIFNVQTYSIYDDKLDIGGDSKTADIVGHRFLPESFDLSEARSEEEVYFIKTHELPYDCVDEADKVIYLIRDGRECVLSYLRYAQNYGDVEKTLEDTIYGNIFSYGWGDHVKAWNANKRKNTLLIKFEELTDNPKNYIHIISDFIEIETVGSDLPLFSELNEINPKFFRAGKKDSWKEVFSEDELMSFWLKYYSQMIEYGYSNDIPDAVGGQTSFLLFKQLSNENSYLLKEIMRFKDSLKTLNDQITTLTPTLIIEHLEQEVKERDQVIQELNNELSVIKKSKSYKFASKLLKIVP